MRTRHTAIASLGIFVTAGFWLVGGCSASADDCSRNNVCLDDGSKYGAVVGPPPGCSDSPSANPDVIKEECGIFVSKSIVDGKPTGSMTSPYPTIEDAVKAAMSEKARVYVCADGDYQERLDIPAGVSVFGGFDCTGGTWKYDTTVKSKITPEAPSTADGLQSSVRVSGDGATRLEELRIEAKDAALEGGSSIAVIVDRATVDFVGLDLVARNGRAGTMGETPDTQIGPANSDDLAVRGNDGQNACQGGSMGNPGGAAMLNVLCTESVGGVGGTGLDLNDGTAGGDGLPMNANGFGVGGTGGGSLQCKSGGDGANGSPGMAGSGATEDGSLDTTRGYVGASGGPGTKGTPGQGGGGGGGTSGKTNCNGASGGSGGAGGCAGAGGLGGGPGGSSLGIVSIGGTIRFQNSTITVGVGGNGGPGGVGQTGAIGGNGGTGGNGAPNPQGTDPACNGGKGGKGGNGGDGGGGRGGHSIGIAHNGGSVAAEAGVMITTGSAGLGGTGGGATEGIVASIQSFP